MKRLLWIGLAFVSCGVMAEGNPCKEPEYLFIKSASKAEVQNEYCYLSRKALSNERDRENTRITIEEKRKAGLDASADRDRVLQFTQAANTCKVAAGALADALARRFQSKPPTCS